MSNSVSESARAVQAAPSIAPKPVIEKTYALLACTECGAEAYASCNCHKAYRPVDLAAKAIAANPNKSNRALAADIGVSEPTVRRARGASGDAPDEHTGLDGKTYPAKRKPAEQKVFDSPQEAHGNQPTPEADHEPLKPWEADPCNYDWRNIDVGDFLDPTEAYKMQAGNYRHEAVHLAKAYPALSMTGCLRRLPKPTGSRDSP